MILEKNVSDVQVPEPQRSEVPMDINLAELVKEFVDENISEEIAKSQFKIKYSNVFGECYRVNVWTKSTATERVVSSFNIVASFLIELKDGKIIDKTIRQ